MPIIEPLVIDCSNGRRIQPDELFKPGTPWLDSLSASCLGVLAHRPKLASDPDWPRTVTAPKAENDRLLYPGPDSLTVILPPYAVAPYAVGSQEVRLPYSRLTGLLDPNLFGP